MTEDTNDKVANIRARLAASNTAKVDEPEPAGVSDDQPRIDLWEIALTDGETYMQASGFYSFNPLGVVIATNLEDGTHVVELIVPWDQVKTFQRITEDAIEDEHEEEA